MRRTFQDAAAKNAAARDRLDREVGALPVWDLSALYAGMDAPAVRADLDAAETEAIAFENTHKGRLDGLARGKSAGIDLADALVATTRALDDLLGRIASFAGLRPCRQHDRPRHRQILRRRSGEDHQRSPPHLLFFTLELNRIDDGRDRSVAMAGSRASATTGPGSRTSARTSRSSSRTASSSSSTRRAVTGVVRPGTGCSTRPFATTALRGRRARSLPLEPTLNLLQDSRRRPGAAQAAEALAARPSRTTCALFTLITNTLAKDKEISDRWRELRGRRGFAPSGQPGRAARSSMRWSRP
jgi:oligoendopeptidase F